jgi:hypothetical protein
MYDRGSIAARSDRRWLAVQRGGELVEDVEADAADAADRTDADQLAATDPDVSDAPESEG